MRGLRKIVISKMPRNKPAVVLGFFGTMALLALVYDIVFVVPDLASFNGANRLVKIDVYTIKALSDIVFVFIFLAFLIATIRNNPKSQPVEALIAISGFVLFLAIILFSSPLLSFWAYIHGYRFDHYDGANRGGWYIFTLART